MMAAQIIVEIVEGGGEIRLEDGRLKVKGIPARLIPLIREHKAALLALLSEPVTDDYARLEREAIQWESEQPPFDDPDGTAGVPWDDAPSVAPEPPMTPQTAPAPFGQGTVTEHPDGGTTIRYLPERHSAKPPAQPPAPATISCGSCAEFEPGPEPLAVGRCSRTANGLPPHASRGYGVCFPTAPRICSDHKEL